MKILLFGDAHFCEKSSIVNKYGTKYSVRIENQLKTFEWIKQQAEENCCDMVIGLGDFFNATSLIDSEITAVRDLSFADIPHKFIVGNHESSVHSLSNNTTKILESESREVISEPTSFVVGDTEICLLPYITEVNRRSITEYFPNKIASKRVILSHNDIKGINYGPVMSALGFDIEDIEANCDFYICGHIHNGQKITNKVYTIGNITGQNFSEDAFKYSHNIILFDTDTLAFKFIENPFAFNFYKIEINNIADIDILSHLKANAVCSIKCDSELVEEVKSKIVELGSSLSETRLIITKQCTKTTSTSEEIDLTVDHLARFIECCKANIENTKLLEEEIAEICK